MKVALDTSILVGFFLPDDLIHQLTKTVINRILSNKIEYACMSKINLIEMGYIIERATENQDYAYNCMFSVQHDLTIDIIDLTWDFMTSLAHLKAVNPISFCDNATLTAAHLTRSQALFSREKEIVNRRFKRIKGPEIIFIEDFNFNL
ncbi:MAG: type II toxin-antitoxin system VapC family toxin [Candidatus Helarchaeota archaeon]